VSLHGEASSEATSCSGAIALVAQKGTTVADPYFGCLFNTAHLERIDADGHEHDVGALGRFGAQCRNEKRVTSGTGSLLRCQQVEPLMSQEGIDIDLSTAL
jgi:hypothetical protein